MYEKSRLKMGREGRRLETQKQQREAKGCFHPRALARAIAHASAKNSDVYGINQVQPGQNQSAFAKNWRNIAARVAEEKIGKKVQKKKHS